MSSSAPDVYSSAQFALELGGMQAATLRSIDGGVAKVEVITYHSNAEKGAIFRQLAKPKYEDIKIVTGLACGQELWNWMATFVSGDCSRKDGALVAADYNYIEKARREFTESLIASIDFPKFDANDKNPANLTITISPEAIVYKIGTQQKLNATGSDGARQQHISSCNFEFIHLGFGAQPIPRVTKVDGFSLKTKVIEYHQSTVLAPTKLAGKLEYPNLAFYMPEIDAKYFIDAHMKTVKGDRAPMANASLTFFDNSRKPKGTISFTNCHVFNVSPEKHDAGTEDVRQVKIEMAIEGMKLEQK
jgi:phage tail-like protein